jgi:NADH-quinone oxidoreductase subunit G
VQDTNVTPLAQAADAVLAGATFAEKAGCYVNADGRLQYSEAALPPRDGSLPDLDLLTILSGLGAGPVRSGDVLAQLAQAVPAFAVAESGRVHEFGVPVGTPVVSASPAYAFSDPWTE